GGERGARGREAGRGRAGGRPGGAPPRGRVDAPAGAGSAVRRRSDRPRPAADALAEGRGGDGVVPDQLYELLPPLYRVRDVESGGAPHAPPPGAGPRGGGGQGRNGGPHQD